MPVRSCTPARSVSGTATADEDADAACWVSYHTDSLRTAARRQTGPVALSYSLDWDSVDQRLHVRELR